MVRSPTQWVARGMSELKDDTVRSMIEQAHEEILDDAGTADEKGTQEAAE